MTAAVEDRDANRVRRERRSGTYPRPGGGLSDHACLGYHSEIERLQHVERWLEQGLQLRQRCLYLTDEPPGQAESLLVRNHDLDVARRQGALVVGTTSDVYGEGDAGSPLAFFASTVERASADGYQGLRVVADMTAMVADPQRRLDHLRWEQLADRYMTSHPLAGLCLYDARRVTGIDAVVFAHPLQGPREPPVALYGLGPDSSRLEGEVDSTMYRPFAELLTSVPASDVFIDVSDLGFVDARSAWILHRQLQSRRAAGQALVLAGARPVLRRMWDALGFDPAFLAA
jgi:anti-anti-sigma regulatory factor